MVGRRIVWLTDLQDGWQTCRMVGRPILWLTDLQDGCQTWSMVGRPAGMVGRDAGMVGYNRYSCMIVDRTAEWLAGLEGWLATIDIPVCKSL